MRILLINSVCGIRSTGRLVTRIAERYMTAGCECRIAYGRDTAPEQYRAISYRIGNELTVRYNGVKARLWDNEGFNAVAATQRFLRWAEAYDPDVLWLHNLHGYYLNVEMLFQWIKQRPQMKVRWTLHDCWAFTGHCTHFSVPKCEKWRTGCAACPEKKRYPASIGRDNSSANYVRKKAAFTGVRDLTLITPSRWLAALVSQSFLQAYPVEVCPNTIDATVFQPTPGDFRARYGLQGKRILLGVASKWDDRKGLGDFIQLSSMLDEREMIVLVGLSQKQMERLPARIVGIPRTNSETELAEIYTAADVLLNLSWEENYPTVNLEAQACGTPCITYRTGGSVESVAANHVVEQGDLLAVLDKVRSLNMKETA